MASTTASAGNPLESGWAHAAYVLGVAAFALALPTDAFPVGAVPIPRASRLDRRLAIRLGHPPLRPLDRLSQGRLSAPARRAAEAVYAEGVEPPRAFLLVTSFRIDARTTVRVYRAAIDAAQSAPGPAVIVASIVEMADQRLIKALFDQMRARGASRSSWSSCASPAPASAMRLPHGFRAIARRNPDAARPRRGDRRRQHRAAGPRRQLRALLPARRAGRRADHRRAVRGRGPADLSRMVVAALRPAPDPDVLDGPLPPRPDADRPDVDVARQHRLRPELHLAGRARLHRPLADRPLQVPHRRRQVELVLAARRTASRCSTCPTSRWSPSSSPPPTASSPRPAC